jgi:O-antigen/teichoic acid export membrane protein
VELDTGESGDLEKGRIAPNAALAVVEVAVSGVTLLLLYRFLLNAVGIEALGVWSLVVSTTSLAGLSSMGLVGGTVRFVSKYLALMDGRGAASAAETAVVSVAGAMTLGVLALWPLATWLIGSIVAAKWVDEARQLVPFALGSLWLQSVGGAIHSGLDGCHRAGTRSAITMCAQPLVLVFGVLLVPSMGLRGIAVSQLLQYLVWSVVGWFMLRRYLPNLQPVPVRWSREMFREMWRYGLNHQAITLLTVAANPLAKALLSRFGGLAALGYFEMANRLVLQVRGLLVAANQVLVPYYSKLAETTQGGVRAVYKRNAEAMMTLASLVFAGVIAMLPVISLLWIGRIEPLFLVSGVLLSVGWFTNSVSVPAYFANLGGGWITRNLVGHIVHTLSVAVLGFIGGELAGAVGCIAAYSVALAIQSGVVVGVFHRAEDVPLSDVVSAPAVRALVIGTVMAASGFSFFVLSVRSVGVLAASLGSSCAVVTGWLLALRLIPEIRALVGSLARRVRRLDAEI